MHAQHFEELSALLMSVMVLCVSVIRMRDGSNVGGDRQLGVQRDWLAVITE